MVLNSCAISNQQKSDWKEFSESVSKSVTLENPINSNYVSLPVYHKTVGHGFLIIKGGVLYGKLFKNRGLSTSQFEELLFKTLFGRKLIKLSDDEINAFKSKFITKETAKFIESKNFDRLKEGYLNKKTKVLSVQDDWGGQTKNDLVIIHAFFKRKYRIQLADESGVLRAFIRSSWESHTKGGECQSINMNNGKEE